MRLSHQFVNKITTTKKYSVVLIVSLFFQHHLLGDSIIHFKCVYGTVCCIGFTAGVFQIIVTVFFYSFRGVGAMEIVAMDVKVRSIVLSIVKCRIFLGKWVLTISRFNPFLFKLSLFQTLFEL